MITHPTPEQLTILTNFQFCREEDGVWRNSLGCWASFDPEFSGDWDWTTPSDLIRLSAKKGYSSGHADGYKKFQRELISLIGAQPRDTSFIVV